MSKKIFLALFALAALAFSAEVENILFDDVTVMLERDIQEATRRQAIIAHNIANAEVEGFKPIRFADELKEIEKKPGGVSADAVAVEDEMVKMAKNRMRHQTYLKLYTMKTAALKTVLNQGK
ncbi:MAG: flagellar basal body protein [Candidatus Margulisbacteria bacterium]|jgi:flagellar basal body rod protein FlgB|nr:flagellar basal body protein [Candidatus Margulisiibacteriota bacterium]